MYSIWKYHIQIEDKFTMELPKDSLVLDIKIQDKKPTMWVLVEENTDLEKRYFRVFGTGHEINTIANLKHLGAFQMNNGALIWHVFEKIK